MGLEPGHFASLHLFDLAFVGIVGIDPRLGFLDLGEDEAFLRRALRRHSRHCVMLADNSKFGRQGSICTYEFQDVDTLITDAPIPAEFADPFDQAQIKVHYA